MRAADDYVQPSNVKPRPAAPPSTATNTPNVEPVNAVPPAFAASNEPFNPATPENSDGPG